MKILVLSDAFPLENNGGAEKMSYKLAKKYQEAGHEVAVLTTTRKKELVGESEFDGLRVTRFFSWFARRFNAYRTLYNPRAIKVLKNFLSENKIDAVHAHNIHICFSYWSLKVIKKMGIPLVLTVHDCQPVCYRKFDCFYKRTDHSNPPVIDYKIKLGKCFRCQKLRFFPLRNRLVRYFLNKYPTKVVAVSEELSKLLRFNGIRVNEVIHNGIEVGSFRASEDEVKSFRDRFSLHGKKIVLFGGRLSDAKGGEQLLLAMKLVCAKMPEAKLLVTTSKDDYSKALIKRAQEAGIDIAVTGWLEGADLIASYAASDLVVAPSTCFDTFGLRNVEGMAASKPIITSCFGGGKEIVLDGETGYVINPFDILGFSEKILEVLKDKNRAGKMGAGGFERAREKFDLNNKALEYIKLLEPRNRFFTTSWDDGNILDLRISKLLDKYGIKGTFYIPKDYYQKTLTDKQIKEIAINQEVGAHTLNHVDLTGVDFSEARQEIEGSKKYIETLIGKPTKMFCYPKGRFDDNIKEAVRSFGFLGARTIENAGLEVDKDNFKMGVTLQVYPFPFRPVLGKAMFEPFRYYRKMIKKYKLPFNSYFSWLNLARNLFDVFSKEGGVFHL
ncbi:glycosyltransferase, partial [Candidatus Falkowbacteria bacterium]|nr:glycosyltransferase [Candidatus Falkowbacteria bacterium]